MRLTRPLLILCLAASLAAAPATQPAAQADVPASDVLVLAFDEIDANPVQDWIGSGVQQSLVADLSQLKTLQTSSGAGRTTDLQRAVETGRRAGAAYVILGSYQVVEPQLRISGQVVDVTSGRVVGALKATGTVRDLFALQDTLGTQAKRILNEQLTPPAQAPAQPSQADPAAAAAPSVVVNVQTASPAPDAEPAGLYPGSNLQRAVRRGSVDSYRRTYDNRSYYGTSFSDYWGFPSAVRSGVWPGYLYTGGRYYHRPPIIVRPRPPHKHPRPDFIPENTGAAWQPPRAAGVPLVP